VGQRAAPPGEARYRPPPPLNGRPTTADGSPASGKDTMTSPDLAAETTRRAISCSRTTTQEPWSRPEAMDALLTAPASRRFVLENDRVRVLGVVIEPAAREPGHTHQAASLMIVGEPVDGVAGPALHRKHRRAPLPRDAHRTHVNTGAMLAPKSRPPTVGQDRLDAGPATSFSIEEQPPLTGGHGPAGPAREGLVCASPARDRLLPSEHRPRRSR
jgi:hypothetical protein